MLIWINGAFGSGKTQTAHELQRRVADAHVADPELLGYAIRKMLPAPARGDFQDPPQWRAAVVDTLEQAEAAASGPVLVPMTIVRDDYFDEIVGGLRDRGVDVRHYTLAATPETLKRRLRSRVSSLGGWLVGSNETWAIQQIPRCVAALAQDRYATHVPTDGLSTDQVVERIARDAGLQLTRPRLGRARYQARRVAVGIRHIRL
ncbi:AAA family ATPase [Flexivirga caeni]|uniref:ATP-binding protein n=1 Tax=Flexivirga caeni TaxID=2294115 RepID=A0A3M9M7Z2_9MICO|nr:AAA family ATPase [Flexivirga caeni]RNI21679.1 ATP-binding protein [Flexivirga caeni]